MSEWIKTSEKLPKDGEWVLISTLGLDIGPVCRIDLVRFNDDIYDGKYFTSIDDEFYRVEEIEHWMPLPEPPKEVN